MFGSTIEYVLRNFTKEHLPTKGEILENGSMHSFIKKAHLINTPNLKAFLKLNNEDTITTPIYPFKDLHLPDILKQLHSLIDKNNVSLLLYADSLRSCELNMLFQYYKIVKDKHNNSGMKLFCDGNENNIVNWNKNYKSWQDMQVWELREWFSLFYKNWVQEWQDSVMQVPDHFVTVKNTDFLYDTADTARRIINSANLTAKTGIEEFANLWQSKQQYIIDEFKLLDQIVDCSIDNRDFHWSPVCIISESILQQRLRAKGYEIQCDGLNIFPIDAKTLHKLLYKC